MASREASSTPNDETQEESKQMTLTVFMSILLKQHDHKTQEPAWLTGAVNLLPSVEDNYLDSVIIDPPDQYTARCQLGEEETFAINKKASAISRHNYQCQNKS